MNTCSANLQLLHRRKRYLAFRILMLALLFLILSFHPGSASVMEPGSFLSEFSLLHLFWFMWMIYLITKLLPWEKLHNRSEYRQFAAAFIARIPYPTPEVIRKHVRRANLQALNPPSPGWR